MMTQVLRVISIIQLRRGKICQKIIEKQTKIAHSNENNVIVQENLAYLDKTLPPSTDASSNSVSTIPKGSIVEIVLDPRSSSSFCK